jgi:hypothetical protein
MPLDSNAEKFCPRCKNFIPRFSAINEVEETRIRALGPVNAMKELRRLTGCEMATAKIWYVHPEGPHAEKIHPPCPYCEAPLISDASLQCLKCGWDWHDFNHPVRHATKPPDEATRIANKKVRWERYRQKRS